MDEMVYTKTIYNMLWTGKLPITIFGCNMFFHASNTVNGSERISACFDDVALMNVLPLSMNMRNSVAGKQTPSSGSTQARNRLFSRFMVTLALVVDGVVKSIFAPLKLRIFRIYNGVMLNKKCLHLYIYKSSIIV